VDAERENKYLSRGKTRERKHANLRRDMRPSTGRLEIRQMRMHSMTHSDNSVRHRFKIILPINKSKNMSKGVMTALRKFIGCVVYHSAYRAGFVRTVFTTRAPKAGGLEMDARFNRHNCDRVLTADVSSAVTTVKQPIRSPIQ
jgi:hypothetical protein